MSPVALPSAAATDLQHAWQRHLKHWPPLEVAEENAQLAGVASRFSTIAGSAFDVEFGGGYDLVLLTNFLHHFDPPTAEKLLRKVHNALKPGGRLVIVQFVPNDDRVSPPRPATFSLILLVTTPGGEAYTYSDLRRMLTNAGFSSTEDHPLIPDFFTVVTGTK